MTCINYTPLVRNHEAMKKNSEPRGRCQRWNKIVLRCDCQKQNHNNFSCFE